MMVSIIRSSLSFITGTAFGVYIAQNYKVPNVKTLASMALSMASQIEQAYRKPKPKNRDDDS
ncbi:uncharacterized protein LOC131652379 [Vicia villosa]|uniref:uncharacterized protein LOC131652379 n=1 Tax=Vicia villosa TaxID=3911 RepID=UPI00273C06CE|nr:uncharacterized protein LOC131652379 [Vicia villosa]